MSILFIFSNDILKEEIEKTNTYCTEFKDYIKKKLGHKSIPERDENEILYERIVLLEKESNCFKSEIKNHRLILQMLTSKENEKPQRKSSKSINPDDNKSEKQKINPNLHVAEENSGPVDKNNDVAQKNAIPNEKPKHVIVYDIQDITRNLIFI